jgi:hypothetical protein
MGDVGDAGSFSEFGVDTARVINGAGKAVGQQQIRMLFGHESPLYV